MEDFTPNIIQERLRDGDFRIRRHIRQQNVQYEDLSFQSLPAKVQTALLDDVQLKLKQVLWGAHVQTGALPAVMHIPYEVTPDAKRKRAACWRGCPVSVTERLSWLEALGLQQLLSKQTQKIKELHVVQPRIDFEPSSRRVIILVKGVAGTKALLGRGSGKVGVRCFLGNGTGAAAQADAVWSIHDLRTPMILLFDPASRILDVIVATIVTDRMGMQINANKARRGINRSCVLPSSWRIYWPSLSTLQVSDIPADAGNRGEATAFLSALLDATFEVRRTSSDGDVDHSFRIAQSSPKLDDLFGRPMQGECLADCIPDPAGRKRLQDFEEQLLQGENATTAPKIELSFGGRSGTLWSAELLAMCTKRDPPTLMLGLRLLELASSDGNWDVDHRQDISPRRVSRHSLPPVHEDRAEADATDNDSFRIGAEAVGNSEAGSIVSGGSRGSRAQCGRPEGPSAGAGDGEAPRGSIKLVESAEAQAEAERVGNQRQRDGSPVSSEQSARTAKSWLRGIPPSLPSQLEGLIAVEDRSEVLKAVFCSEESARGEYIMLVASRRLQEMEDSGQHEDPQCATGATDSKTAPECDLKSMLVGADDDGAPQGTRSVASSEGTSSASSVSNPNTGHSHDGTDTQDRGPNPFDLSVYLHERVCRRLHTADWNTAVGILRKAVDFLEDKAGRPQHWVPCTAWQCLQCLAMNDEDDSTCALCGADAPGQEGGIAVRLHFDGVQVDACAISGEDDTPDSLLTETSRAEWWPPQVQAIYASADISSLSVAIVRPRGDRLVPLTASSRQAPLRDLSRFVNTDGEIELMISQHNYSLP